MFLGDRHVQRAGKMLRASREFQIGIAPRLFKTGAAAQCKCFLRLSSIRLESGVFLVICVVICAGCDVRVMGFLPPASLAAAFALHAHPAHGRRGLLR